jgi:hypothetical protein
VRPFQLVIARRRIALQISPRAVNTAAPLVVTRNLTAGLGYAYLIRLHTADARAERRSEFAYLSSSGSLVIIRFCSSPSVFGQRPQCETWSCPPH